MMRKTKRTLLQLPHLRHLPLTQGEVVNAKAHPVDVFQTTVSATATVSTTISATAAGNSVSSNARIILYKLGTAQ